MKITLTLDLTPENLEVLKILCAAEPIEAKQATEAKNTKKVDKSTAPTEVIDNSAPIETHNTEQESISKTDVRALALKLSKAGKQDTIKEIFSKFGAEKLSDVKETDYSALMKELVSANG